MKVFWVYISVDQVNSYFPLWRHIVITSEIKRLPTKETTNDKIHQYKTDYVCLETNQRQRERNCGKNIHVSFD
jgi:hypothetical protein